MAKSAFLEKMGSIRVTRRGITRGPAKSGRSAKASVDVFGLLSKLRTFARARWRVVVVVGIALAAACYYLLLSPATDRLEATRADEETLETRSSQLLTQVQALQSAEGAAAAANRFDRATYYDELLPTSLNQLTLLAEINSLFATADLDIRELSPVLDVVNLNPSADPELGFFAFQFAATGTTEEVQTLIEQIEQMRPLATVSDLTIAAQGTTEDTEAKAVSGTIRVWASRAPSLDSLRS